MTMTVSTSELETIRRKLAIKHCPVTLSLKLKKKVQYFQTKNNTGNKKHIPVMTYEMINNDTYRIIEADYLFSNSEIPQNDISIMS